MPILYILPQKNEGTKTKEHYSSISLRMRKQYILTKCGMAPELGAGICMNKSDEILFLMNTTFCEVLCPFYQWVY